MHWEPEFKEGCADKRVSPFIDLQNAVAETQENHWAGINNQKKERSILEFKLFKKSHGLACKYQVRGVGEKNKGSQNYIL